MDASTGWVTEEITTGCPSARTACDYAATPVLLIRLCPNFMCSPSRASSQRRTFAMIQPSTALRTLVQLNQMAASHTLYLIVDRNPKSLK